jgi:hypothetical protein
MHGEHHDGTQQNEQSICALFVCIHKFNPWKLNFFGAFLHLFFVSHQM